MSSEEVGIMKTLAFARFLRQRIVRGMFRLLQRMDDSEPRRAEGAAATAPLHLLRPVTVIAEAQESEEQALEDWSRGLDWVHWLFSGIRQRMEGIYFRVQGESAALYPRVRLSRQSLLAQWDGYAQRELLGSLGARLIQAWLAAQKQDLETLLVLEAELDESLPPAVRQRSAEAGERLLAGTRGARYQGLMGRYRRAQEDGRARGHFFIVWAVAGHFFQLSLASVIAEYLRLEWDIACRDLPAGGEPLGQDSIAGLTSHLMHSQAANLALLSADGITEPPSSSESGNPDSLP